MNEDQDETIVVSRTKPMVEEETVVTSSSPKVNEDTVTNPTISRNRENTSTGPQGFGVEEDSEPAGPIPTFEPQRVDESTNEGELTIEREIGEVFVAPTVVATKAIPLPVVDTDPKFVVQPEEVKKSKPSADASKLFKKNLNRTKRNSIGVLIAVIAGALLTGVTLALLYATLT